MPKLVALYIRNVLIGFAIAAAFVAMLLWFNIANLWGLVSTSSDTVLAVALLVLSHGVLFAGVQSAIAIMLLAEDDDTPERGKPRRRAGLR